jgi:hypothetical protein
MNTGNEFGRVDYKHRTNQYKQEEREDAHELLDTIAQLIAHNLRKAHTTTTQRQHTRQIVVHRSGEDCPEDYP